MDVMMTVKMRKLGTSVSKTESTDEHLEERRDNHHDDELDPVATVTGRGDSGDLGVAPSR